MSETTWRQRFRLSPPPNPWEAPIRRTWRWQFVDDHGNGWGRWFVEPETGGSGRLADPDLPAAYSTGIAPGNDSAIIGLATPQGFTIQRVEPGAATRLLFQHQERTDVGTLSRDESRICLIHAQEGDWQHPALIVCNDQGKALTRLSDGPECGLQARAWSPIPMDQRLIILREVTGWWRPALWSPETGEMVDCSVDLPGDVDAQWYPDAQALLLIHEWHGRGELYRFDLQSGQISKITTEPGTIWAAGVDSNDVVWYRWNNATRPSEVRNELGERLYSQKNDAIPHGVAYTDIEVDGIHGFLAEPSTPRPHPTIFLVYGHPVYHYTDSFYPMIQAWVDHGFAVVLLNCRGSSGYGRSWRDASLRNVGWTELEDAAKVHDWIMSEGIADPMRVVLGGDSWGGYLTLLGLGIQPRRWSLGIAAYPFGDSAACYQDASEPIKATVRVQFGGTPEMMPAAYAKASPLSYVDHVRAPIMLTVGKYDHLCPIRSNEHYMERLRALGKPFECYLFAGGHGTTDPDEQIRQIEAQINFVASHLGTRRAI